mgnify:CR=1 FL=1
MSGGAPACRGIGPTPPRRRGRALCLPHIELVTDIGAATGSRPHQDDDCLETTSANEMGRAVPSMVS